MKASWLVHPRSFAAVLVLLPLLPLSVLYARDWIYDYFQMANTETPQASLLAWEMWVIAAACWVTALGVLVAAARERDSL